MGAGRPGSHSAARCHQPPAPSSRKRRLRPRRSPSIARRPPSAKRGRPLAAAQYHQLAPPAHSRRAPRNNVRIAPVARTVTPIRTKTRQHCRPSRSAPTEQRESANNAARPGQAVNAPPANNANAPHPARRAAEPDSNCRARSTRAPTTTVRPPRAQPACPPTTRSSNATATTIR